MTNVEKIKEAAKKQETKVKNLIEKKYKVVSNCFDCGVQVINSMFGILVEYNLTSSVDDIQAKNEEVKSYLQKNGLACVKYNNSQVLVKIAI